MAILTTQELLAAEPTSGGAPFYLFSTRSTPPDASDMTIDGSPFYTPHYVSGGTPPPTYNFSQFFLMF